MFSGSLVTFFIIFYCVGDVWSSTDSDITRPKRTTANCPRGCASCSPVNGCVTCESRYFMFLYRQNIRQIGICTPSCPVGYYGVRYQYYNKCNRCHIEHCQACFSRHYCTRCEPPYLAFQGQCIEKCPNNTHYANYSKECRDRVDCMVGPWSSWSQCSRNGVTCGYRYGVQTKTRQVLEYPSVNGAGCPTLVDSRTCVIRRRPCSGQCNRRKRHRRRKKKRKKGKGKGRKKGKKDRNRGRRKNNRKRKHRRKGYCGRRCRRRRCNRRRNRIT
ncbi:R-spondin-2 isoform X1 [Patella vulgata]|uniref:R-spondin-2 isoform X1 n=1 Tax=Patella vulgata TaxID=6465 RepID=UPI00217F2432|nr:R-spondin-2 isoform X1 [Patella vulgata]